MFRTLGQTWRKLGFIPSGHDAKFSFALNVVRRVASFSVYEERSFKSGSEWSGFPPNEGWQQSKIGFFIFDVLSLEEPRKVAEELLSWQTKRKRLEI